MKTHRFPLLRLAAFAGIAANSLIFAAETSDKKVGFDQKLELHGITFHVTCPNEGSVNRVKIVPSGLTEDNKPIDVEVDGYVTGAEVADLNADGSPEIYVYTQSAGSGSYASLIAYAANRNKSITPVTLPDLSKDKKASAGFSGHDTFAVVENRLIRRFPLYKKTDTNSQPSGKTRQIQYRLVAGEAGWILRADKVVEY
ncbi:MAG: PliI family lysozyme inhibitor of I-type lysozyme [Verrucomicrobiota bacterium]